MKCGLLISGGQGFRRDKKSALSVAAMMALAVTLPTMGASDTPLVPATGILHGIVTWQSGDVSQQTDIITQTDGSGRARETIAISAEGEFIMNFPPGTYRIQIKKNRGGFLETRDDINVFSDITTFVFFNF